MLQTLETCRETWNFLLNQRKMGREKNRREQYHSIYEQKQKLPYLRDAYSHVLQNVADRLDKSYKSFFKGNTRYPRFKRYGCYNSFTYPDAYNGSVKLGSALRKTKLYLSMVGYVRVIVHRDVPPGEKDRDRTTREIFGLKTCTIKNESDKWFAILTYNTRKAPPLTIEKPERPVGIDLGLINAIATSDCHKIPPLRPLRQNEKRLKRLQRSLSRKKKGSKNREKARLLVSRLHWSIGMQRANFVHTVTRRIVDLYDFLALEDLRIRNMLKNHALARALSDVALGKIRDCIAYKAERQGKKVVYVPPQYTSTTCSRCGLRKRSMPLSVRTFKCERCSLETDRDFNSGSQILRRGLEQVGLDWPELKPMEIGVQNFGSQPIEEVGSSEVHRGA